MRRDALYLKDIVIASEAVARYVAGLDAGEFAARDIVQDAVLHRLLIIGEAVSHISPETKAAHPEIEWRRIAAFRNLAIHAYFSVQLPMVWQIASVHVPELEQAVRAILNVEHPELLEPDAE